MLFAEGVPCIPHEAEFLRDACSAQIIVPSREAGAPLALQQFERILLVFSCAAPPWDRYLRESIGSFAAQRAIALIDADDVAGAGVLRGAGIPEIITRPVARDALLARVCAAPAPSRDDTAQSIGARLMRALGMEQFVGASPAFRLAINKVEAYCPLDTPVLICGETGTGKESIARALHYLGPRADKPFIPVNCGAIPDTLFENEVFGHERGAYTDASRAQRGLVQEAEGGTVFFDEVNTLSHAAQVKLLRFLEDRRYRPLGASRYVDADVRVVCATNVDLRAEVASGRLREDLFYRINLLAIDLPPLRDRGDDAATIARYFLRAFSHSYKKPEPVLTREAWLALLSHRWPGNVRELKNVIERAVIDSRSGVITLDELGVSPSAEHHVQDTLPHAKHDMVVGFERSYLLRVLAEHGGNVSHAARAAGKDRRGFQRLLRKHGIDKSTCV